MDIFIYLAIALFCSCFLLYKTAMYGGIKLALGYYDRTIYDDLDSLAVRWIFVFAVLFVIESYVLALSFMTPPQAAVCMIFILTSAYIIPRSYSSKDP